MSSALPHMSRPQAHSHVIDNVVFDLGILENTAPLNKADFIKEKINDYLLPAIEQALESFNSESRTIHVKEMNIDLGHFPEDTPWFTVRENLKSQLLNSLLSQDYPAPRNSGMGDTESGQKNIDKVITARRGSTLTPELKIARISTLLDNLINSLNNVTEDTMPGAAAYVLGLLRRHPAYLSLICQSQASSALMGLVKHLVSGAGALIGSPDIHGDPANRPKDRDFWAQALKEVVELKPLNAAQLRPFNSDNWSDLKEPGSYDKANRGIAKCPSRAAKPKVNSADLIIKTTGSESEPDTGAAVLSDANLQTAAFLIDYLILNEAEPSFKETSHSVQLLNLSTANGNWPNIRADRETNEETDAAHAHGLQACASNFSAAQISGLGWDESKTYIGQAADMAAWAYYQEHPIDVGIPNDLAVSYLAPQMNFRTERGLQISPFSAQASTCDVTSDHTKPQRSDNGAGYYFLGGGISARLNLLRSPNYDTALDSTLGASFAPPILGVNPAQVFNLPSSGQVLVAGGTLADSEIRYFENSVTPENLGDYRNISPSRLQPRAHDAAFKLFHSVSLAPLIFGAQRALTYNEMFSGEVSVSHGTSDEVATWNSDKRTRYHILGEHLAAPLNSSQSHPYDAAFKLFFAPLFDPLRFVAQPAHASRDVKQAGLLRKNGTPAKAVSNKSSTFRADGPNLTIDQELKIIPCFCNLNADQSILETKILPSITELPSPVEGIGAFRFSQLIPMNINIGAAIGALIRPILAQIDKDLIDVTVGRIPASIRSPVIAIEQVVTQNNNGLQHRRLTDDIGINFSSASSSGATLLSDESICEIYNNLDHGVSVSALNLDLKNEALKRVENLAWAAYADTHPRLTFQSKTQLAESTDSFTHVRSFTVNPEQAQSPDSATNWSGVIVGPHFGMDWSGIGRKTSNTLFSTSNLAAFNNFNHMLDDVRNSAQTSGGPMTFKASVIQSPASPITLFPMRRFASLATDHFMAKTDLVTAITTAPPPLAKAGPLLRSIWQKTPRILPISLQDYSGTELLTLLEAILPAPVENGTAPLIIQARKAMTLSKAPAQLMQKIISCCVDDAAIDFSKISKAIELENIHDPRDVQKSHQGIASNDGIIHQSSFTKSQDLPKTESIIGRSENASMIAEIEKAISMGSHHLLGVLAQANNREQKITLYLNLTHLEQRRAFVKEVGPLFYQRDFKILNQLWEALTKIEPDYSQHSTLQWEFIILRLAQKKPHGGGQSSLVEQALRHFESDPHRIKILAGTLLKYILSTPYNPEGGISLELTNNLRSILSKDEVFQSEETIKVRKFTHTAGLVLLRPHFATLFKHLGLIEDRKFGSFEDQVKATNLLIYLSHGQSLDLPKKHLYLERILCGIPSWEILPEPETITPSEQELIDDMLRAVIGQWSVLGTTSPEGLRESFIRRDGDIQETDESTILTVAPKAFDMLLDRLPWSISITKLAWMQKPLSVNWRN